MSDYAFTFSNGRTLTPNGTDVPADSVAAHNAEIEVNMLDMWARGASSLVAYFDFPVENIGQQPEPWRASFMPLLRTGARVATVKTWCGTVLGTIDHAKVYTGNFGGRIISLTVRGTNGARYHGRASWDNGTCVVLRKSKGQNR